MQMIESLLVQADIVDLHLWTYKITIDIISCKTSSHSNVKDEKERLVKWHIVVYSEIMVA